MEDFKAFADHYNFSVTATLVPNRLDDLMSDTPMAHYQCNLMMDGKLVHTFYYSVGVFYLMPFFKKKWYLYSRTPYKGHRNPMLGETFDYFEKNYTRYRSEFIEFLIQLAAPNYSPPVEEVLYSLALDASGVEDGFKYWAGILGYSDDSIKAKKIYDHCVETRFALESALGRKGFDELLDCEE